MAKNIVVCCDGTGNEFGAGKNTNVVRVFEFLDKSDRSAQVAFYDPGVGTIASSGVQTRIGRFVSRLIGLATGYGMTHNIEEAYRFLMENYEDGDRVYLFGFSRGAYTVRALTGMLKMCGLLERGASNLIPYVIKLHQGAPRRAKNWFRKTPDFQAAREFKRTFCRECKPHYVGIWDTVKTVGYFRSGRRVLPYTADNEDIRYGRHAVSIDEQRRFYRQNLWTYGDAARKGEEELKKREGELGQRWFAGVHSDLGGGYDDTGLSDIALEWVLDGAIAHKLKVTPAWKNRLHKKPDMPPHDSLRRGWWLLGGGPRKVPGYLSAQVYFHDTAQERIQKGLTHFPARRASSTYIGNITFWLLVFLVAVLVLTLIRWVPQWLFTVWSWLASLLSLLTQLVRWIVGFFLAGMSA